MDYQLHGKNLTLDNYKFILFEWQLTKDAIRNSVTLGLAAALYYHVCRGNDFLCYR